MIAKLIGRTLCRPAVRATLLNIARATPDEHICGEGGDVYMFRYWLFNPIHRETHKRRYPFIPISIRIQRTMRADADRHLHDHPFNAWYWIMGGGYDEVRLAKPTLAEPNWSRELMVEHRRLPGDFVTLRHDEFHKIVKMNDAVNGSMSFFVFGPYKGPWGFLVNAEKVLFREYKQRFKRKQPSACLAVQHSDQMLCETCDLGWDVNDPERPMCRRRITDPSRA